MKKQNNGQIAATGLAIACIAVALFAKSASIEAAYPVERAKILLERHVFSRLRGMWRGAEAEVECRRLKAQVELLSSVESENRRYEKEIDRLREALGYVEAAKGGYVAAEVLSEGGGAASVRKTVRVGKGSLAGVREGAAVMAQGGLAGKVTGVTPHTAEVTLITDPSVKVSCAIEGDRRMRGVLCGGTGELVELKYVTPGAKIPERAMVYTSGLGGVFPADVMVGVTIDGAWVRPSVDFENLTDVFIRREK